MMVLYMLRVMIGCLKGTVVKEQIGLVCNKGLPVAKSETAHLDGSVPLRSRLGKLRAPHIRKVQTQCGHPGSVSHCCFLLFFALTSFTFLYMCTHPST